jgi:two-component system CheB/CheR fusion protein
MIGVAVIYTDISRTKIFEEQLKQTSMELTATNEELQATNEELETTNEELQSTVEELETTNEELQSTNEELETLNEELQSTNEELETINDELGLRTSELNIANYFLETILANLKVGVIVVDRNFHITNWNKKSEDFWGLRTDEVAGQSLLGLDFGLPVEKLKLPIRTILDSKADIQELILDAHNRRGKAIKCWVTCTTFYGPKRERQGVVLMMEEQQPDGTQTSDGNQP